MATGDPPRPPGLARFFERVVRQALGDLRLGGTTEGAYLAALLTQFARASIRATAFFNDLDGAIANVTLSQTPQQIIRQRQNSDTIRATGLEI